MLLNSHALRMLGCDVSVIYKACMATQLLVGHCPAGDLLLIDAIVPEYECLLTAVVPAPPTTAHFWPWVQLIDACRNQGCCSAALMPMRCDSRGCSRPTTRS